MAFDKKAPDWRAEGIEPPLSKREIGWEVEDKPPAAWLNWYMNSTSESIQELQTKAAEKAYVDEQISEAIEGIDVDVPDASLTQKGVTLLSNATNGTRENVAATEKAVGLAFQSGNERKAEVVAALVAKGIAATTSETWVQLIAKLTAIVKATGNAVLDDVLAGKTFSNANGNNLTGTMVRQPGYVTPAGYYPDGTGILYSWIPKGAYLDDSGSGSGLPGILNYDPDFIAANFREGKEVFGMVGSLKEDPYGRATISYNPNTTLRTGIPGERFYDYFFNVPGGIRVLQLDKNVLSSISHTSTNNSTAYVDLRLVDRNGLFWYVLLSSFNSGTNKTTDIVINFEAGTTLHVYDGGGRTYTFNKPTNFDSTAPMKLGWFYYTDAAATYSVRFVGSLIWY